MTDRSPLDVLVVRASLPAPGWTVLDAARDQRFTGELRAHTDDGTDYLVYVDRGEVYCAERSTDPTLGTRLVEAGAINTAQLDYGVLRIGDIEHLGRLFDRVPSINRDAVFVLNQLMTEETMRTMAARSITDVDATPYRHHPSGMHRWTTLDLSRSPAPWGELPELSLPAPAPDARPVSVDEPAPAPAHAIVPGSDDHAVDPDTAVGADVPADDTGDVDTGDVEGAMPRTVPVRHETQSDVSDDLFLDDVVQWDEPSLLVSTTTGTTNATTHERRELFPTSPPLGATDWVDELGPDGVTDVAAAPARQAKLPPVHVPPVDQFEVIWPSGEVDDVTTPSTTGDATVESADTATAEAALREPVANDRPDTADGPHADQHADRHADPAADQHGDEQHDDEQHGDEQHDAASGDAAADDALAVRRAVASIDTGSLAVRRRLASPGEDLPTPPGRLIVGRDHHTAWRNGSERPTGSVFDAQPAEQPAPPSNHASSDDHQERRAGALRRLIGSLRKTDD